MYSATAITQQHRFGLADAGNIYGRLTNPTEDVFEQRIAALEGGVAALAVASGAAAITYTIENLAQNGDHIVSAKNIYGGSLQPAGSIHFRQYGITTTFRRYFRSRRGRGSHSRTTPRQFTSRLLEIRTLMS